MASVDFEEQEIRNDSEKDCEQTSMEKEEVKAQEDTTDTLAPTRTSESKGWDLVKESYCSQLQIWPTRGRHILAHYDDDTVVVYQAFKSSIAQYAVENQRFGGPDYKFTRMSWIKTNFLWMMFRCGWSKKHNQEHVLAIRITRAGFEQILSKAYLVGKGPNASEMISNKVRLQWDPDHKPNGNHERRRAIQLGLRGRILEDFCTKFIVTIKDITEFAHEQHHRWQKEGEKALITPRERVYIPSDSRIHAQIELDFEPQQTVVAFHS